MRPKPHHSSWFNRRMGMIKQFIQKSLSLFRFGKEWIDNLLGSLTEAARTISYVETINPQISDTLHREIKYSEEIIFKRAFEENVRKSLPLLKLDSVKVAIDVTEDLYWGKWGLENTRASAHEHQLESWQYVNLSIVEPYFIPLMSIPYKMIDSLDDCVIELLEYLRTLPLKVDLVLFDRGFYHWYLIDYLNGHNRGWAWPYVIFVPQNDAMKNFIEQTKGSIGKFVHQDKYTRDQTSWVVKTRIIILKAASKNKNGDPIDWCFTTNQNLDFQILKIYRKRWNIETGFRIHDEARIKSKSANPLIRLFYHLLGMLFILVWRINNQTQKYEVFKRFLRIIEREFYQIIVLKPT